MFRSTHNILCIPGGEGAGEAVFPSKVNDADVRSFSSPLLTIAAIVVSIEVTSLVEVENKANFSDHSRVVPHLGPDMEDVIDSSCPLKKGLSY